MPRASKAPSGTTEMWQVLLLLLIFGWSVDVILRYIRLHSCDVSNWDANTAVYEQDVFELEIVHSDGENPDREWKVRLGNGGQIASFRVAAGEAIANQASSTAAWNDLVQQMVAVNGALNTQVNLNFIHQAGPYIKDTGCVKEKG